MECWTPAGHVDQPVPPLSVQDSQPKDLVQAAIKAWEAGDSEGGLTLVTDCAVGDWVRPT